MNLGSAKPRIDGSRISGNVVIADVSGSVVNISGNVVNISGSAVRITNLSGTEPIQVSVISPISFSGEIVTDVSGDPVRIYGISGEHIIPVALPDKYHIISTAAPLNSGQIYVSSSYDTSNYMRLVGSVFADNTSGILYIDHSTDASNWDVSYRIPVIPSNGRNFSCWVTNKYVRVKYINFEEQQSSFRLSAILCAL